MNFAGPTFVLAIIAMSTLGWMFTTWVRARHGYPVENDWTGTVRRTHRSPRTDRHRSRRPDRARYRRAALTLTRQGE